MDRTVLSNLNTNEYEHPFDKKALTSLEATPGLPALLKAIRKYSFDKVQNVTHAGSYLRIGENQYPKLYTIFRECCEILDFKAMPKLYMKELSEINAYATCFSDPLVTVTSGAIEKLTEAELYYLIGHELGHVKSQHLLYHDLAGIVGQLGVVIGDMTLGLGNLFSFALQIALMYWQRMSELTSDRAGLLACQDITAAVTAISLMAGGVRYGSMQPNIEEFMLQARQFVGFDYDALDKIAKYYSAMDSTHPWTVMRAHELDQWVTSGQYEAVLRRKTQTMSLPFTKCPRCGEPISPDDLFCGKCGCRKDG